MLIQQLSLQATEVLFRLAQVDQLWLWRIQSHHLSLLTLGLVLALGLSIPTLQLYPQELATAHLLALMVLLLLWLMLHLLSYRYIRGMGRVSALNIAIRQRYLLGLATMCRLVQTGHQLLFHTMPARMSLLTLGLAQGLVLNSPTRRHFQQAMD